MKAIELIAPLYLEISKSQIGDKALQLMQDNHVSHLPVVENKKYLGLVSEIDCEDAVAVEPQLMPFKIGPNVHFWDVLKFFKTSGVSVIPVVTEEHVFLGVITKSHLVDLAGEISTVQDEGAIVELMIAPRDYSMSQIAQIVEGNDVKIHSVLVNEMANENLIMVVLKLNSVHISGVMQTFSRYNMSVRRVYNYTDDMEWLNDRKDGLIRYLDF
jgi:CBS domain-containing protein